MIKEAKIYKYNKLLKVYRGISKKGVSVLYLYTAPKNFRQNIDEAEQAVAKQKSKKRKYTSLIFFLINMVVIGIILGIQISNQGDMSLTTLLNSTFSPSIFLLLIVVWVISQVIEAFRTNILVKQSTGRSRPFLSYKTNAIGKYYDCITPMSTGGQPFQIFYMTRRGLNAASAISVPMGRYVIGQLCISAFWTICLIIGLTTDLGPNFNYIKPLCIIGWILNAIIMVTVTLLSVNQRIGKKIVVFVFKFLQKIKIVKNYEKLYNQVIKTVTDFQITIKNFTKEVWTFLLLVVTNLINIFINYSLTFLVYSCLVGFFDFSILPTIFILSAMIDMAASFMPLPGGTGVSEISFAALFTLVIPSGVMLTWALLIWRFMTYYVYLLQGIILMGYDNIWGNKKYLWLKKKWELETESITFTQDKLHEYTLEKINKKQK